MLAVGAPAHQVAGAVEPRSRRAAERVGHEPLGGQRGPAEVAARHAGAADAQLARHPDRHRPHAAVEHVGAGVGDRPADRHAGGAPARARPGAPGDVHRASVGP